MVTCSVGTLVCMYSRICAHAHTTQTHTHLTQSLAHVCCVRMSTSTVTIVLFAPGEKYCAKSVYLQGTYVLNKIVCNIMLRYFHLRLCIEVGIF